jgi:membrane protease YdiL (CAAX protease family)
MSGARESSDSEAPTPARAISAALGVALVSMVVIGFAFQSAVAGALSAFAAIGLTYAVFGVLAVVSARRRGEGAFLMPRSGDFTMGGVVAGLLYVAAMGVVVLWMPHGVPREGWIVRIYALLGDPADEARHILGAAVFFIAIAEELTWRGLVYPTLRRALGTLRAAVITTALFAMVHVPTAVILATPAAGPNPLLPLAALGCGAVWMATTIRLGRLSPALFAHGLFTWAVVEFPLWRPF